MNNRPAFPLYAEVEAMLERIGSLGGPAELHGMLCGMLCGDPALERAIWFDAVRDELIDAASPLDAAGCGVLEQLFLAARIQLTDETMGFDLLLPDDDELLAERTEALGAWCQGFVYGLGRCAGSSLGALSGEAKEFLDDLREISRVGFDAEQTDEADEVAYSEVVEYLRMGTLVILDALRPRPTHEAPDSLH